MLYHVDGVTLDAVRDLDAFIQRYKNSTGLKHVVEMAEVVRRVAKERLAETRKPVFSSR